MPLLFNSSYPVNYYVGTSSVQYVYLGDQQLYPYSGSDGPTSGYYTGRIPNAPSGYSNRILVDGTDKVVVISSTNQRRYIPNKVNPNLTASIDTTFLGGSGSWQAPGTSQWARESLGIAWHLRSFRQLPDGKYTFDFNSWVNLGKDYYYNGVARKGALVLNSTGDVNYELPHQRNSKIIFSNGNIVVGGAGGSQQSSWWDGFQTQNSSSFFGAVSFVPYPLQFVSQSNALVITTPTGLSTKNVERVWDLFKLNDGGILVNYYDNVSLSYKITKLEANGNLWTSSAWSDVTASYIGKDIYQDPQISGGFYWNFDGVGTTVTTYGTASTNHLFRFRENGNRDTTFNPPALNAAGADWGVQPTGRVVYLGGSTTIGNNIGRLTNSGSDDNTFQDGTGLNTLFGINSNLVMFSNGNFAFAASSNTYNGASSTYEIKYISGSGQALYI